MVDQHTGESDESDAGDAQGARARPRICLELTRGQLEAVVRAIGRAPGPSVSLLLSGLDVGKAVSARSVEEEFRVELERGRMSYSLVRGLLILAFFLSQEQPRGVVEAAQELEMSASTMHRYLNTLAAFGLLVQEHSTRKYRIALR